MDLKPSNFTDYPMGSVLQQSECEVIAQNIMKILKRTGDTWRELTWDEYKKIRTKDGNFTNSEQQYFDKVINYCKSADTAVLFCNDWAS